MSQYVFDIPAFRISYPAFADPDTFSDEFLQSQWDLATCYVSDNNSGCGYLSGDCRYKALTLMTAHLAQLSTYAADQQLNVIVTEGHVDKVGVQLMPPPVKSQWAWWLSQTTYGAALLALLAAKSVGGMYIGGAPEIMQFPGICNPW